MTTNATLLTDEIVDFLYENGVSLTISLDGPQNVQDNSRVFAESGKGTFEVIMGKLDHIKEKYPGYMENISFKELVKALKNEDGRKILANYGLDPKLGKYHRTYCDDCQKSIETKEPVEKCPMCGGKNVTFGVFDRIELIKDKQQTKSPKDRPPYIYQIPLGFIPGVGGKTISKLLNTFETEMNILHKLSKDDIEMVVGEKIANNIENARNGNAKIHSGGGGVYGKVSVK